MHTCFHSTCATHLDFNTEHRYTRCAGRDGIAIEVYRIVPPTYFYASLKTHYLSDGAHKSFAEMR